MGFPVKFCLLCAFLSAGPFYGQSTNSDSSERSAIHKSFQTIVRTLAHDSMGGRYAGSEYELKAHKYLTEYISFFIKDDYRLHTEAFAYCCRDEDTIMAHNIWVWPEDTNRSIIVFAAHYDHLPPNSNYSKEIWHKDKVHPGADDNASGVAMALGLFRYFYTNQDTLDCNIGLLLFSGHEEGLHGSAHWIENHLKPSDSLMLMINFDMVGRMAEETSAISLRIDKNSDYLVFLKMAADMQRLKLINNYDSFRDTDSYVFFESSVQAFTISTGIHNDYHRTTDTVEKINFDGMSQIFEMLINFVKNL